MKKFQSCLPFVVIFVVAVACNREPVPEALSPETPPKPPPVIFISLDTFRADVLDVPHTETVTPHLDRFRSGSVTFHEVFAQMPFTLPSHMSMWTGLQPTAHDVTTAKDRLSGAIATLPEILKSEGYRTIGWMSNDWIKADFGFSRGFDSYTMITHDLTYAKRLNEKALQSVTELRQGGEPWFLFLHYMDPHSDFNNVKGNKIPYYAPPEYWESLDFEVDEKDFCDDKGNCATGFLLEADRTAAKVDREKILKLHQLYLQGIRALDTSMGELFAGLKAAGVYDEALILVTSDHGEEFREHGLFLHSQTYDETLRIPLLIKFPHGNHAGTVYNSLVETVDLLPTILDFLGWEPVSYVQGRSLMPILEEGRTNGKEYVLSQDKLVRSKFCLRTSRFKLIYDIRSEECELYDLKTDPGEAVEASATHSVTVDRLRSLLLAELRKNRQLRAELASKASSQPGQSVLTEEEQKRLKALGYVE